MVKRIIIIIESLILLILGLIIRDDHKTIKKINKMKNVENSYKELLIQWHLLNAEGYRISDYLKRSGYNKVAVYGMNGVAVIVIDELIKGGIIVSYGIDKAVKKYRAEIDVIKPELISKQEKVDAIVVAAVQYYDEIEAELRNINIPIISLKSIVNSLL